MANQEDDLDLGADDDIEELEEQEKYVKRGQRIIGVLIHQCETKITDPQEAETFNSAIEALAQNQEDMVRCLSHMRGVQDAEEDIESLSQAAEGIKLEGDPCEEGSTGKKISSEFGESSGEGAADVVGQLGQKSAEFEANLYFLLARLASLTPESKEEEAHYDKFKTFLNLLLKDSKNEIIRGILELVNAFQLQVGNSGSSKGKGKGKVHEGRSIDSLLNQALKNIQLVGRVIVQISKLSDPIKKCEAEQNDIQSKIKALKGMD